jgi:hypothetical protein
MGWAIANGGDIGLFLGTSEFVTIGVGSYGYELWFYQFTLLFTTIVIFSNATLTRVLNGHVRFTCVIFLSLAIFPVLYHWGWSFGGWASSYRSEYKSNLLRGCGVIDSAGSSIIHMSSGCAGLVLLWLVKPRLPRNLSKETTSNVDKRNTNIQKPIEPNNQTNNQTDIQTNIQKDIQKNIQKNIKKKNNTDKEDKKILENNDEQKAKDNTEMPSLSIKNKKEVSLFPPPADPEIMASDFATRQLFSYICAPLLIWIGFIG